MNLVSSFAVVAGSVVEVKVPAALRSIAARYITASAEALIARQRRISSATAYATAIATRLAGAYGGPDWARIEAETNAQLARWTASRPGAESPIATIEAVLEDWGPQEAILVAYSLAGHRRDDCACAVCLVDAGTYPEIEPVLAGCLDDLRKSFLRAGAAHSSSAHSGAHSEA